MGLEILFKNKIYILLHISAWLLLFIIPPIYLYIDSNYEIFILKRSYLQSLVYISLFYLNYFILIPFLYDRKQTTFYVVLLVISIFLGTVGFIKIDRMYQPSKRFPFRPNGEMGLRIPPLPPENGMMKKEMSPPIAWPVYNFVLISLLSSGFGLGLRHFEDQVRKELLNKEMEREKLNSELTFLKTQISPHFFFNTLNNIYSLADVSVDSTQKAIIQLSKLMRYLLYESESVTTQLDREIEFMSNYVELMKLRINPKVKLKVSFPKVTSDIQVPPLLFISFIENAFKHGISSNEPSFITIVMKATPEEIYFWCSNSIIKNKSSQSKNQKGGIGLENIKKRLNLLYPGKYSLSIKQTEVYHSIELIIKQNKTKEA